MPYARRRASSSGAGSSPTQLTKSSRLCRSSPAGHRARPESERALRRLAGEPEKIALQGELQARPVSVVHQLPQHPVRDPAQRRVGRGLEVDREWRLERRGRLAGRHAAWANSAATRPVASASRKRPRRRSTPTVVEFRSARSFARTAPPVYARRPIAGGGGDPGAKARASSSRARGPGRRRGSPCRAPRATMCDLRVRRARRAE